jgi:hypothetical protein
VDRAARREPGGVHRLAALLIVAGAVAVAPATHGQRRGDDPRDDNPRARALRERERIFAQLEMRLALPSSLPSPEELSSVEVAPAVRAIAAQLDARSFAERERATEMLIEAPAGIDELCVLLSEAMAAAPERSYRLLQVLEHRLTSAPKGALGISMRQIQVPGGPAGIEIDDVVDGMPAQDQLLARDVITRIDGQPVTTTDQLSMIIQRRRPGEEVRIDVQRPRRDDDGALMRDASGRTVYDEVEISMPLGSFDDLKNPAPSVIDAARERDMTIAIERYAPRPRPIVIAERVPNGAESRRQSN